MTRTCLLALILLAAAEVPVRAEEPDAERSGRFLAGAVVDDQGRPVAAADVWLTGTNLNLEPESQGHAQSDRDGRFRIPVPVRWFTRQANMMNSRAVFAWKQGTQLAVLPLPNSWLPAEESVRLALKPTKPAVLTVHDPSGRPAEEIRLRVSMLMNESGHLPLPDELSDRFAVTTDEKGEGALTVVSPDRIGRVALESKTFGRQEILVAPEEGWTGPLVLGPVGMLKGRVTADDPQHVSGLEIDVSTGVFNEHGGQVAMGTARVTTGPDGRFEVPAIRHGNLRMQVDVPADVPFRARTTQSEQEFLHLATDWAVSGDETEIEIPLEPAVRVTGVVRRQETSEPLPGIAVHISSHAGWKQLARSDKDGRFAMYVLPGQVLAVPSVPYGYFAAQQNVGLPAVAAGAKEAQLPAIELLQAVSVRGRVVDDAGQPVPNATVRAIWNNAVDQQLSDSSGVETTTDDQGAFTIEGVHPRSTLALRARSDSGVTERMTTWQVGSSEPPTLTVSDAGWLRPEGRVIDSTGAPVGGATVTIHEQTVSVFAPRQPIERPLELEGEIRTDEQGRFTTRPKLERFGHYQAEASVPGFGTARTGWVAFSQLDGGFPPIVLRRTIEVRGRVVDTQGSAVPDASVTFDNGADRIHVELDEQGRFHLGDVPAGLAFVFAHKPGHRFTGRLLASGDEELTLTLVPSEQPGASLMKALPPILNREERHALAQDLVEPILQPDSGHHEGYVMRACEILGLLDPAGALERLESRPAKQAELSMALRMAVAQQLAKTEPDEALLVGESIEQPMWRSKVYLDVYDALPESERPRKLDMLGQAIVQARGSDNPSFRAFLLGQIGERLLDLGEKEKATEVLREGEEAARGLPTVAFAGYARGAFAEELAQIDLEAALKLTEGLNDEFEYNRHHGNIAHELAAIQPADAERVLKMVKREGTRYIVQPRDQYLVRVCYRMASVDPERARRIADSAHDPCQRAYAYGMMAQALAERDKESAAVFLRHAFEVLQTHVDAGKDKFNYVYSASTIAAALLPVAERIDAGLVPEFFWRAVSMRLHAPEDQAQAQLADLSNAALAMFLSRYDRRTAQALLLPVGPQARSHEFWLRATTLVDPRRAVEHVRNSAGTDKILQRENARARLTVAKTLARDGEELWGELLGQANLWVADKEDL